MYFLSDKNGVFLNSKKMSSKSPPIISQDNNISIIIKPHPTNTFFSSSDNGTTTSTQQNLYYYHSSLHDRKEFPSLLGECFRYFQSKPPSSYFLSSTSNQHQKLTSTTQSIQNSNSTSSSLIGPKLNEKSIFRIPILPLCQNMRQLAKLPYFNYDLYFHYDYINFSTVRRLMSMGLILCLGTFSKFFLNVANSSKFYGKEKFRATIEQHYESVSKEIEEISKTSGSTEPPKVRG